MDIARSSHRGQSKRLTRRKKGLCGGHALIMNLKHVQSL